MAEVTMPRLSDTMSEGAVGRWLKKPGDAVADGEIIAEIETDKATMELQAFESGTLQKILVPEGQTVPIGQTIAIIGDGAAPAEEAAAPPEQAGRHRAAAGSRRARATTAPEAKAEAASAGQPQPQAAPPASQSNGQAGDERIKASPLARRMADERGIDLRQVQGTGPAGGSSRRISRASSRRAAPGRPTTGRTSRQPRPQPQRPPRPRPAARGRAAWPHAPRDRPRDERVEAGHAAHLCHGRDRYGRGDAAAQADQRQRRVRCQGLGQRPGGQSRRQGAGQAAGRQQQLCAPPPKGSLGW